LDEDFLEENKDEDISDEDAVIATEDEFESKSMFDMFFGKKNKNKGQDGADQQNTKGENQKQVRQKIEKEETP